MTHTIRQPFISDLRPTVIRDCVLQIMDRMAVVEINGAAMPVALGADTSGKIKKVVEYFAA